jgi:hypothetical protein
VLPTTRPTKVAATGDGGVHGEAVVVVAATVVVGDGVCATAVPGRPLTPAAIAAAATSAVHRAITGTVPGSSRHTGRVGFNPYRARQRRPSDYVFVAAGLVVGLLLVLWALLG